jgi:site-specific DNA-methyltransferase (adenine-specific)
LIIGDAELIHGDCLDYLDAISDADAIITDPPYGIDLNGMSGTYRSKWVQSSNDYLIHGDDTPFDPSPWIQFKKVILWGGIHFAARLPESRAWIVWDKREGTTSDNQADCEIAWTNLPGPARLYSQLWRGSCRRGEENISRQGRVHPTQKPVALMSFCIDFCKLDPGALIVDPYMGSGTTGVSAVRYGYRFIGIEIEKRYFDTACHRIRKEQEQMKLFS